MPHPAARTLLAAAIAGLVGAALAPSASAVFPGTNGKIVVATALTHPVSGDSDVSGHIVWLAARGRRAIRLFRGAKPSFSPSGSRLAYQEPAGFRIAVSRADGSDRRTLVQGHDTGRVMSPVWSPLGSRLAFLRGGEGLFEVRARGDAQRLVLPSAALEGDVAWSPAGSQLALAGSEGPIQAVALDGSNRRTVGKGRLPSWITEDQLLFQRRRSLYLTTTSGGRGERLVADRIQVLDPDLQSSYAPEFSLAPSRKRVAFARRGRIYVVGINGGAARAITPRHPAGACCPAFSPDGRLVAFVRGPAIFVSPARGGTSELFAHLPRAPGCAGLQVPRECDAWVAGLDWQARRAPRYGR